MSGGFLTLYFISPNFSYYFIHMATFIISFIVTIVTEHIEGRANTTYIYTCRYDNLMTCVYQLLPADCNSFVSVI